MSTFAERLFDELSAVESGPDFELFCTAIGSMFQPIEDIAGDTDDGDIGYSILLDIDRAAPNAFGFLAQFVGMRLLPGLSDDDQRAWIRSLAGLARGRPASIEAAAAGTLIGSKMVLLRERDGSAWRFTVITRVSETPNPALTEQAVRAQKPGPDILIYETLSFADYQWVKDNVATYADLEVDYTTYDDLKNQEI
jgi:hypothetical protein